MLSKLLTIISFAFAFNTPYPYMIILGLLGIFFVWCGAFLKIKNGVIGYLLYILAIGALITGMFELSSNWSRPEDTHLDNKTVRVLGINRNGFLLDSGERVVPAGITMPVLRHLRELTNKTMPLVKDTPVKLTWDDGMCGYRMLAGDTDISEFLVVNGYAKPSEDADILLHELAEHAKKNKLGVWNRPFLMKPQSPVWIAVKYYFYNLLQWATIVGAVLAGIWTYNKESKND